jgi:endonuclease/exonuclease/phosphatase family metal-dependent hydrolase
MTRILSYNILVGGAKRIDNIERIIRAADPDVVGLVEATNQDVVKELARRLKMEYRTNASPDGSWRASTALLSRLPIAHSQVHAGADMRTHSLLEVSLEEEQRENLTVFVTHLTAFFSHGRGGDSIRCKEVQQILRFMQANQGPHVLIGDFNALAPGDTLKASRLLRYLIELDRLRASNQLEKPREHPSLNFVVPPRLRFLIPLLRLIPRSPLLSSLFDEAGSLYARRGSISLLREAGYVDCFRYTNPRAWGFTCPATAPAGRIDYLFANPQLASRLSFCKVIPGVGSMQGREASDHLPVVADFSEERIIDRREAQNRQPIYAKETTR